MVYVGLMFEIMVPRDSSGCCELIYGDVHLLGQGGQIGD